MLPGLRAENFKIPWASNSVSIVGRPNWRLCDETECARG
jgi:hypothetical protein